MRPLLLLVVLVAGCGVDAPQPAPTPRLAARCGFGTPGASLSGHVGYWTVETDRWELEGGRRHELYTCYALQAPTPEP